MKYLSLVSVFHVSDIEKSSAWYKKWIDGEEIIPEDGVAEYKITGDSWLQLSLAQKNTFEKSSVILGVEDILKAKKYLDGKGITTSEIADYGVVKIVEINDPDGNSIFFAQEI